MEGFDNELLTWMAIAVAAVVAELLTVAFVALYIAVGALAAAAVVAAGGDLGWQLAAFSVVGIGMLLITRPVLKRHLESPDIPTNVSRMIGRRGIVTIPIDNDANTGQIRVGTEYWTARAAAGQPHAPIGIELKVRIVDVEGVTARVEPLLELPAEELQPPTGSPAT